MLPDEPGLLSPDQIRLTNPGQQLPDKKLSEREKAISVKRQALILKPYFCTLLNLIFCGIDKEYFRYQGNDRRQTQ
jgi:hypothetical protein